MLPPQHHGIRPMDVVPHSDKVALRIEQLDAVRFPIHYIDGIVGIDGNIVWPNELARVNAGTAPGAFVGPGPRINMNPGVAIAVGDVDVPIAVHDGCRGRPVKRGAAPLGCRLIARANLHHPLARGRELLNGMDAIVGHQQRAIVGDIQAVGAVTKESLAKRAQVVPVAIKDHERVLATGQDVYMVLGIHSHPRAFLKRDTLWEFAPPLDILIPKVTNPIHFTHRLSPFHSGAGLQHGAYHRLPGVAGQCRGGPQHTLLSGNSRCHAARGLSYSLFHMTLHLPSSLSEKSLGSTIVHLSAYAAASD